MKNDCAQRAAAAQEAAEVTACAAGRIPATPDEIVRFRMLLEQTLAAPADETRDENAGENADEAAQASHPDGLPRHGRAPFGADNGRRRDAGIGPAPSRTVGSDPSASAPYRAAAVQPDARRRAPATQPDAEALSQETTAAGRPAAGVDLLRDLVAEILFAVELPDRHRAIGLEMHSAVLPDTRICLTMNDDQLSVLLQTRSEPVYRDALAHRNVLVQTLVQRCARAVAVEIEFEA